jgi:hypothetical protein
MFQSGQTQNEHKRESFLNQTQSFKPKHEKVELIGSICLYLKG